MINLFWYPTTYQSPDTLKRVNHPTKCQLHTRYAVMKIEYLHPKSYQWSVYLTSYECQLRYVQKMQCCKSNRCILNRVSNQWSVSSDTLQVSVTICEENMQWHDLNTCALNRVSKQWSVSSDALQVSVTICTEDVQCYKSSTCPLIVYHIMINLFCHI